MILVLDNYDSFTWNLVNLLKCTGAETKVKRNDEISLEEIRELNPRGILISPGPGKPIDSGICVEVVRNLSSEFPILGICLGHQLIGEMFGAKVVWAKEPMHGKTEVIQHDGKGIFSGIPEKFRAMRYHSLILSHPLPPENLQLSAWTEGQEIMGIRHKSLRLDGLQFHPESILSEHGQKIISNWVHSF